MSSSSHETIRESLRERIQAGEWELGQRIPDEVDLAVEYSCARATINRAVQALAEGGLVIRKRKGGTRVNPNPVRQAKFEIPVVRELVESNGGEYRHELLVKSHKLPPQSVRSRLNLKDDTKALFVETLHLSNDKPYAFETRWVNILSVPPVVDAPLNEISANEWLVNSVPFSSGDVAFSAVRATNKIAKALQTEIGAALFAIDRTTWLGNESITTVRMCFHEGYRLTSEL